MDCSVGNGELVVKIVGVFEAEIEREGVFVNKQIERPRVVRRDMMFLII